MKCVMFRPTKDSERMGTSTRPCICTQLVAKPQEACGTDFIQYVYKWYISLTQKEVIALRVVHARESILRARDGDNI